MDGVPTDLRLIDSVIERPGFMFNPTHCAPASFSGTASGTPPAGQGGPGATAGISTSFDLVGCKGMAFAPKFSVSTSGKTSKSRGASLTAKVSYPYGPQGTYADVGYVKVELPKQLPSRLTTLQKACTQKQSGWAGCGGACAAGGYRKKMVDGDTSRDVSPRVLFSEDPVARMRRAHCHGNPNFAQHEHGFVCVKFGGR